VALLLLALGGLAALWLTGEPAWFAVTFVFGYLGPFVLSVAIERSQADQLERAMRERAKQRRRAAAPS
jgi:hypothetical protein